MLFRPSRWRQATLFVNIHDISCVRDFDRGISDVRRACGLSRKAIAKEIRELSEGSAVTGRVCQLNPR